MRRCWIIFLAIGLQLAGCVSRASAGSETKANNYSYTSTGTLFANLGNSAVTPQTNGTGVYCQDCVIAPLCSGGGAGAWATRLNNAWNCGNNAVNTTGVSDPLALNALRGTGSNPTIGGAGSPYTVIEASTTPAVGATTTCDFAAGNRCKFTLTQNITSLTAAAVPPAGEHVYVDVTQGSPYHWMVTWNPAIFVFANTPYGNPIQYGSGVTTAYDFISDGTHLNQLAPPPHGRAGVGVMTAGLTVASGVNVSQNIGALRSIDGKPLLVEATAYVTIDNTQNAAASCFEIDAPFPGVGGGLCNTGLTVNASQCSESGSTITCNSTANGLSVGDSVNITGISPSGYNGGPFMVTAAATNTFSYSNGVTSLGNSTNCTNSMSPCGIVVGCDWNAIIEASLNSTNFGHEYTIPAGQITTYVLPSQLTNLRQFGGTGKNPPNVSFVGSENFSVTLKNQNNLVAAPCSSNAQTFGYFIGGFTHATELSYGDLGGNFFE